jgi:hypothetical protein
MLVRPGLCQPLLRLAALSSFPQPSVRPSRSSVTPFVSGRKRRTRTNWSTIIAQKNTNGRDRETAAMAGKSAEMSAFMIQCVALPRLWPRARTAVGKISLR